MIWYATKEKILDLMDEVNIISAGYRKLFGKSEMSVKTLPESGSYRKYYRITDRSKTVIGVHNSNAEENEAFIGFTRHFISKGLPVPGILGYLPESYIYYLQDLGDLNLFNWLHHKHAGAGFDDEAEALYRKILDKLIDFQIEGIKGLDLDLCYPHRIFDRQSMMWDMNYFKYMFLKLIAAPFNEQRLEHDFHQLADFLLECNQDYFLYRDFQSANIMLLNGTPWFIDYQGGRKGAAQYDAASLLYDAKAYIPDSYRQNLINYYIEIFCSGTGENEIKFREYFPGFSMIRLMQALGAFGFRGLYEKKPTFAGSIVPAVKLLAQLVDSGLIPVSLPELFKTVRSIPELKVYNELEQGRAVR